MIGSGQSKCLTSPFSFSVTSANWLTGVPGGWVCQKWHDMWQKTAATTPAQPLPRSGAGNIPPCTVLQFWRQLLAHKLLQVSYFTPYAYPYMTVGHLYHTEKLVLIALWLMSLNCSLMFPDHLCLVGNRNCIALLLCIWFVHVEFQVILIIWFQYIPPSQSSLVHHHWPCLHPEQSQRGATTLKRMLPRGLPVHML